MLEITVIGVYLAIGSIVALLAWSRSNKNEWLADNAIINGLTFLSVMIFWPKVFVIFVRVLRRRIAERRKKSS